MLSSVESRWALCLFFSFKFLISCSEIEIVVNVMIVLYKKGHWISTFYLV